jgi:antitoxin component HigA of HigAB toxin-antitoxin module
MEIVSATLTVDSRKYARLANRVIVKAIETEQELDRMVAEVERLMDKGGSLSVEESALLETLAILIQAYEDHRHPLPPAPPGEMLAYLLESSGRPTRDLLLARNRQSGWPRCSKLGWISSFERRKRAGEP